MHEYLLWLQFLAFATLAVGLTILGCVIVTAVLRLTGRREPDEHETLHDKDLK